MTPVPRAAVPWGTDPPQAAGPSAGTPGQGSTSWGLPVGVVSHPCTHKFACQQGAWCVPRPCGESDPGGGTLAQFLGRRSVQVQGACSAGQRAMRGSGVRCAGGVCGECVGVRAGLCRV